MRNLVRQHLLHVRVGGISDEKHTHSSATALRPTRSSATKKRSCGASTHPGDSPGARTDDEIPPCAIEPQQLNHLGNNPQLVVARPILPPAGPVQNLNPPVST